MTSSHDLLVITASNGKNLQLAKRFLDISEELSYSVDLLDLTTLDLPLYNPRTHEAKGIPSSLKKLNYQLFQTAS